MPLNVAQAVPIAAADEFDAWLTAHGGTERDFIAAIFKKASGKQTVSFDALLETALCHGWVDVQTKGIDPERYAIRFVPRRAGSTWSATNRAIVARLLAEGRLTERGQAVLPPDLTAPDDPTPVR